MKQEFSPRLPYKTAWDRSDCAPLHPGEILREDLLPHYRLTTAGLGRLLGVSPQFAGELLAEKRDITADLAHRLGSAFNLSTHDWLALQMQYDLWHASEPQTALTLASMGLKTQPRAALDRT